MRGDDELMDTHYTYPPHISFLCFTALRTRHAQCRMRRTSHCGVRLGLFEESSLEFEEDFRERPRGAFRDDFLDDRFSQRDDIQRL